MSEPFFFTVDERRELVRLLDLAVKAGGLQVAPSCLHFVQKLQGQPAPPPDKEE